MFAHLIAATSVTHRRRRLDPPRILWSSVSKVTTVLPSHRCGQNRPGSNRSQASGKGGGAPVLGSVATGNWRRNGSVTWPGGSVAGLLRLANRMCSASLARASAGLVMAIVLEVMYTFALVRLVPSGVPRQDWSYSGPPITFPPTSLLFERSESELFSVWSRIGNNCLLATLLVPNGVPHLITSKSRFVPRQVIYISSGIRSHLLHLVRYQVTSTTSDLVPRHIY